MLTYLLEFPGVDFPSVILLSHSLHLDLSFEVPLPISNWHTSALILSVELCEYLRAAVG
jgi:hypothetical protein